MKLVHNPRSVTDAERELVEAPLTAEDLGFIAGQIKARLGYSDTIARAVVGWLAMKSAGLRDESAPQARAQYRKILRELTESVAPEPPPGRREWKAPEAGNARIIHLAAFTAGAAGAVTGHAAAGAAAFAVLYITDSAGDELDETADLLLRAA